MSVQVENFENSHIQGSRAFAYLFAQFSRMFAISRNVDIDYSLPSEILAALHTNKSSSSVDTHLAGIIRAHLGYFAMFDISLTDSDPCIHGKTREHFFR
jgi:hypothetical protein